MEGLRTHDVLIKGGEWKLGSNEEPKPFQTVRVRKITMHPAYQPTNLESDIALLHLENDLKFDKHIGPICIDESELEPTGSDEECVTSGWGKEIIKCKCISIKSQLAASVKSNSLSFKTIIKSKYLKFLHRSRCWIITSFTCDQSIVTRRMPKLVG